MPTKSQTHIDQALTNMSVAYMQITESFISDRVFPKIPVRKQSDVYFVYDKGDFFRDEMRERAASSESVGGEYGVAAASPYYCKQYSFHKDVTEQERANSDNPLNCDQDATDFVTQKALIKRESRWASDYFATGKWGTEYDGVDSTPASDEKVKWDISTSTPIEDITNEIVLMASQTGFKPNTLVLGPKVLYALKNHPDILDRIKYTQRGIVTSDILAALFEVDRILVPWGVVNTANQEATDDIDFIMGNHALLMYVNPRPAIKQPSAGYTFTWTGFDGAGEFGNRIVRLPMDQLGLGTERIEIDIAFDNKIICSDLGSFFKDIVD